MKTQHLTDHGADGYGSDRYAYDFDQCSARKGFAQVDTRGDACYFGTWANPTSFVIVCYAEGDVSIQTAENADEFIEEICRIASIGGFLGIDPMLREAIEASFRALGLGDLLH